MVRAHRTPFDVTPRGTVLWPHRKRPPQARNDAETVSYAILLLVEALGRVSATDVGRALYTQFCGEGPSRIATGWAEGHLKRLVKEGGLIREEVARDETGSVRTRGPRAYYRRLINP